MSFAPQSMFCSECGRSTPADELARFGDRLVCLDCKNSYAQKLREGVAIGAGVRFAGFWIRVAAALIDAIILFIAGSILQYAVLGSRVGSPIFDPANPEAHLGETFAILGIAWLIGTVTGATYEGVFVYKLGATPGKMALGLKVVRPGGGPVSLGRAIGRYFAKLLSAMILGIGYFMVGFDSEKRGMHDMICDTRVIKTN
ncbi:MAG TPA: RDD family protein [Candidatus Solibacter sp.]|jgi:uncharacterized RDD family membrane protein YckC|nr:RDD family protein [Candidatus Solibacter sp.]